jgi:hypothetical protein
VNRQWDTLLSLGKVRWLPGMVKDGDYPDFNHSQTEKCLFALAQESIPTLFVETHVVYIKSRDLTVTAYQCCMELPTGEIAEAPKCYGSKSEAYLEAIASTLDTTLH